MAAPLKIDASDLLGKLHVAAIEKVNKEYSSVWKKLSHLNIGLLKKAESSIVNSAYSEKDKKMCIPPDGKAWICINTTGTNAEGVAKGMFKTYMQWFAGMPDADLSKYENEDRSGVKGAGQKYSFKNGSMYNLSVAYELTSTERAGMDLQQFSDSLKKGASASDDSGSNDSSDNSDVIDANESVELEETSNKVKAWESEHPFESIFNEQNKEDNTMLKESKTTKFVKQVAKQKNVAAQRTLEEIIREKVEKRVKDVLSEEK